MKLPKMGLFFLFFLLSQTVAIGQVLHSNSSVERTIDTKLKNGIYDLNGKPIRINFLGCTYVKRSKTNPLQVNCQLKITSKKEILWQNELYYNFKDSVHSCYQIIDYYGRAYTGSLSSDLPQQVPAGGTTTLSITFNDIPSNAAIIRLLLICRAVDTYYPHTLYEKPPILFFNIPLAKSVPKPPQILQTSVSDQTRFDLSECKRQSDSIVACGIFVSKIDGYGRINIPISRALLNSGQEYRSLEPIPYTRSPLLNIFLVENVPTLMIVRFNIPKDITNIRYIDFPDSYGAKFENIPITPYNKRPSFF